MKEQTDGEKWDLHCILCKKEKSGKAFEVQWECYLVGHSIRILSSWKKCRSGLRKDENGAIGFWKRDSWCQGGGGEGPMQNRGPMSNVDQFSSCKINTTSISWNMKMNQTRGIHSFEKRVCRLLCEALSSVWCTSKQGLLLIQRNVHWLSSLSSSANFGRGSKKWRNFPHLTISQVQTQDS